MFIFDTKNEKKVIYTICREIKNRPFYYNFDFKHDNGYGLLFNDILKKMPCWSKNTDVNIVELSDNPSCILKSTYAHRYEFLKHKLMKYIISPSVDYVCIVHNNSIISCKTIISNKHHKVIKIPSCLLNFNTNDVEITYDIKNLSYEKYKSWVVKKDICNQLHIDGHRFIFMIYFITINDGDDISLYMFDNYLCKLASIKFDTKSTETKAYYVDTNIGTDISNIGIGDGVNVRDILNDTPYLNAFEMVIILKRARVLLSTLLDTMHEDMRDVYGIYRMDICADEDYNIHMLNIEPNPTLIFPNNTLNEILSCNILKQTILLLMHSIFRCNVQIISPSHINTVNLPKNDNYILPTTRT